MTERNPITDASHRLCAALHQDGIDPSEIEIILPKEAWWRLYNRLEQLYRGFMVFDGRYAMKDSFKYMGVTYRSKST